MRIAVCDDEAQFRVQIRDMIDRIYGSMDVIIDLFSDGRALLERFDANPYDVLFLDIEMPAMDGITLAKKLRERSENVFLVFLTSHVEYALEGYEVNALRYLTKPIREDKLREVLSYVMKKNSGKRQLMIKSDGEELRINIADVIYLEAQNQYVMIHALTGDHLVRANLSDFEEQLKKDGFFRIHRGYLISLLKVKKLVKSDVTMEGGALLPVSRNNLKALRESLYSAVEQESF
ncbi:MAG: response regulator transcription factor [Lachnospiraceae bacterium]|nr:response regulator transcription factor [Lachnospiraceae bacterium]